MASRLAFDTGGTFTDFALIDDEGVFHLHKVLSTPKSPAEAVIAGIKQLLDRPGLTCDRSTLQILGATTAVTNAVLERKGVKTAFLTTRGFEDLLRIRNEGRYDLYDLNIEYPAPLVPRSSSYGIAERVAADGRQLTPLDVDEVKQIAGELSAAGYRSVAVCLLHAYRFPGHERSIAGLFEELSPRLSVSISAEVCPEIREYERASTTVVNAYTRPMMEEHVAVLEASLRDEGIHRPVLWMTSSGGMVPSAAAARTPVKLIESGPAAGVVAAAEYARTAKLGSVMSFDMGGTTAKLCLIPHGAPMVGSELEIARHKRFYRGSGYPLRIQSIQMIEIGAGGGSIASRNQLGLLEVGPESAGASPGPACYGKGGTEPTVTDADLLLGYIDPGSFLGGEFMLSRGQAETAMAGLAATLGVAADRAAWGIHDQVNATMAEAASMHASDHGIDPATLPLIAFGGAGPVHAYGVARKLGSRMIICPAAAGVTSAVGLLLAPVAVDLSASRPMQLADWDGDEVDAIFGRLEEEGRATLYDADVASAAVELQRSVDARYVGQGHEITVPLPAHFQNAASARAYFEREFEVRYAVLFGRTVKGAGIEAITWRLRVSGPKGLAVEKARQGELGEASRGVRPVYFEEAKAFVQAKVYTYSRIPRGLQIAGPAIIEQPESTVVIGPAGTASIDADGNVIVMLEYAEGAA